MPRDVLVVVSSATLGDAKYRDDRVCLSVCLSVCPFVRRRLRWEQVRVVHGLGWVGSTIAKVLKKLKGLR